MSKSKSPRPLHVRGETPVGNAAHPVKAHAKNKVGLLVQTNHRGSSVVSDSRTGVGYGEIFFSRRHGGRYGFNDNLMISLNVPFHGYQRWFDSQNEAVSAAESAFWGDPVRLPD